MRTFGQKQNRPQKQVSSSIAWPNKVTLGTPHREHPILRLQRTIGNQAVLRLLQTSDEELKTELTGTVSPRFGDDFSRIPAHPPAAGAIQTKLTINQPGDIYEQEADRVSERVMRTREPEVQHTKAQPALNEAVHSPGQPLEADTRAFMEPRFRHDFSGVRVHHDAKAGQSADAVNARAYTVGNEIVFGRGEYAPGTTQGRSLIAHELAHVVQQRDPSNPHPALQCAAKTATTSAGKFVADPYDETVQIGAGGIIVGYGADITIKFEANERVDAEKIAFVQTALSVRDDKVSNPNSGSSRTIPQDEPGEGTHIDQDPSARMPLYGMEGKDGDELANPKPRMMKTQPLTEIGWHYTDASKKPQNHEAMMHDDPGLNSGDVYTAAAKVMNREWHQHFETTALALAGNQKGTFYGSVEWGWAKSVADAYPKLLEFRTKSENVPSPVFMEAARLWNVSVTTDNKDSIDLPVDVHITSESVQLWDSPDQRKKIATLTKDTPLGRIAKVDPKGRTWWASVTVTGGPNVGKTGWVMEVHLQ